MNTDIRLSVGFWQHPKTYRLEKRAGLKGVRSLQILWCWCAQNRPDGNLADLEADEIEFVAGWRGKKGVFVEACMACGWLDETDAGFSLHEWANYNPYQAQAASREEARKKKASLAVNARWGREQQAGAGRQDAPAHASPCSNDAQAYAQDDASICSDDANADANACPGNAQAYAQTMPPVPVPVPEEININTASPDGAAEHPPVFPKCQRVKKPAKPPDEPHYQAKSGAYLTGATLAGFERFWEAFDLRKGKAEAADVWLKLAPGGELLERVCAAAGAEAASREELARRGQSPKWAQGWLAAKRWEDYEVPKPQASRQVEFCELTPEEKARADAARLSVMAKWRKKHSAPEAKPVPPPQDAARELACLTALACGCK